MKTRWCAAGHGATVLELFKVLDEGTRGVNARAAYQKLYELDRKGAAGANSRTDLEIVAGESFEDYDILRIGAARLPTLEETKALLEEKAHG